MNTIYASGCATTPQNNSAGGANRGHLITGRSPEIPALRPAKGPLRIVDPGGGSALVYDPRRRVYIMR